MTTAVAEPATTDTTHPEHMAAIEQKLDVLTEDMQLLTEQVKFLTEKAYDDRRRQQEWDELKTDMMPMVNDMYMLTVQQLEEIQAYVQLEDLLHLLKRLARNTHNIDQMLDQLESLQDLAKDLSPLTKDMFEEAVIKLDEMEQKGYFGFIRQSAYVMDQIVTSFSDEDVRHLGDNVVLILNTVKALTQPEMMNLVNNLTRGFHDTEDHPEELPTSMFGLLGQMRDPDVRRGLALTMTMLKRISQQYDSDTMAQVAAQPASTDGNGHP